MLMTKFGFRGGAVTLFLSIIGRYALVASVLDNKVVDFYVAQHNSIEKCAKLHEKWHFFSKKFGGKEKRAYLCSAKQN